MQFHNPQNILKHFSYRIYNILISFYSFPSFFYYNSKTIYTLMNEFLISRQTKVKPEARTIDALVVEYFIMPARPKIRSKLLVHDKHAVDF